MASDVIPEIQRYRMRNDNVLVQVERRQLMDRRAELIHVPDVAKPHGDGAVLARVVDVGPGYYPDVRVKPSRAEEPNEKSPTIAGRFVPTTVRVGELVLLDGALAGEQLWTENGVEFRIVREAEIMAVVEP